MRLRTFAILAVLALVIVLVSIAFRTRNPSLFSDTQVDRTNQMEYWGGYKPNTLYATTEELLFDGWNLSASFYWPTKGGVRSRKEMADYKNDPDRYAEITLVQPGTEFRIVNVYEHHSFEFSALRMVGEFQNGKLHGTKFDVHGVSESKRSHVRWQMFYPSDFIQEKVLHEDKHAPEASD